MDIWQSALLNKIPWLINGLTTNAHQGQPLAAPQYNMSLIRHNRQQAENNRLQASRLLGLDNIPIAFVYQEHSTKGRIVLQKTQDLLKLPAKLPHADFLCTNLNHQGLGILVADCLPIMLVDRVNQAIGLVHSGWRGSLGGIVTKAIQTLKNNFGSQSENILAVIGPGIGACCFPVGEDVWQQFEAEFSGYKDIFCENRHIDLKQLNYQQLLASGIKKENIEISLDCTVCIKKYFSFRRQKQNCGLMMGILAKIAAEEK